MTGPGGRAAARAQAGLDHHPAARRRDRLELALDGVVPGLDAGSLVGALFAASYTLGDPAGRSNPLELLALDDELPPGDVLPVGLLVLSALARLCQSESVSVLKRTPGPGT